MEKVKVSRTLKDIKVLPVDLIHMVYCSLERIGFCSDESYDYLEYVFGDEISNELRDEFGMSFLTEAKLTLYLATKYKILVHTEIDNNPLDIDIYKYVVFDKLQYCDNCYIDELSVI